MIRRVGPLFAVALVFSLAFVGCSDETLVPSENEQSNTSGLIEGNIDVSAGSFEYTTDSAGDPDNPMPGPFIIRGKNVHYVDSLSVLSVDFTVEHRCRCSFPEPIGMTFVNLFPQGVTVENPDNDEHGPGASIVFEFENDDGRWTPFEESLPRTVLFGVDPGVSIGFVARIDIGMDTRLGSIGGVVWNDHDEDGQMDQDEPGIGGVEILMSRTDGPETSNRAEIMWRTLTSPDGSYRFDSLEAGHYEVHEVTRDDLRPTTPTTIQVILVEQDGGVGDFLMANFGCVPVVTPRPIIEVGDFVDVWGEYSARPEHHVTARSIQLIKCGDEPLRPSVVNPAFASADAADLDVCDLPLGALVGPVTDINRDARVLWVIGTPIRFEQSPQDTVPDDSTLTWDGLAGGEDPPGEEVGFDDVQLGDQVTVFALNVPDHRTLDGVKIYKSGVETFAPDIQVHGKVDEILMTPDRAIDAFIAMRTKVFVTELTRVIIPVD
jgi:hypothetical protein